ncbi:MAG: PEP-CTERM system histidine kinase PrsK [candidate division Zixibacteria bacterium]|nr:PEP-CTERM system histidine kinase PrsK [candidate division Zixibacteria bacterium]NIV05825.1 PEP-CTERM system histidine kinase PrsK [candidate division Zixibacteria bacterium]
MYLWESAVLLSSSIVLLISSLVALLGRTTILSRGIFFIGGVLFAWLFFRFYIIYPEPDFENLPFPIDLNIIMALLPFVWLLFSMVFAREDYRASLRRGKLWLSFAGLLALALTIAGAVRPLLILAGDYPAPHEIMVTRIGQWYFLYLIVIAAMVMINFENTYRSSWGIYRRKLRPPILILGLMLILLLFSSSLVLLSGTINRLTFPLLGVLSALAAVMIALYFLRYEPQQSGVYVRRHAIYSSIAIIIIGFYLILAGAIGKIIQVIGGDIKLFASVLGALVAFVILLVLVLSRSIKERIKGTVEKTLHPGQIDFEEELASFSEDVAIMLDPEELTSKILELFKERLGIGKLYLFYTDPNQEHLTMTYPRDHELSEEIRIHSDGTVASWLFRHGEAMVMDDFVERLSGGGEEPEELEQLQELGVAITLPLIAKQRLVGILFLGPKADNETFTHREIQFISSIGHQFSLALFSSRLSEELLHARQIESFHKFTTFIMHDLKNSISMLSMLLQNYEANIDNTEFQKSAMTTINGAVNRMQRIMDKLKSGEKAETFAIMDCNPNEIVLSLESKLGLNDIGNVEYKKDLKDVGSIKADPDKLSEVIRNLIINALEAMPEGGKLEIATLRTDDRVIIQVSDTGLGMSSDFISSKLFKPFATTKKKGLGIGLFQSKDWVEKMHGKMIVKSTQGEGTSLSVEFPAQE